MADAVSAGDVLAEAGVVEARDAAERAVVRLFATVLGRTVPGIDWQAAVPEGDLARIAQDDPGPNTPLGILGAGEVDHGQGSGKVGVARLRACSTAHIPSQNAP
ncbi:hypothetical protein DMB66_16665 [Actinoplanes sp. ATCC 53533]|uniref:hypothetical protein n=1 Tax=Actinoplanes sp. ATCC 53533 TaxID=1288362 RepID=UPI000F783032|nr:hypothetical protein [Actinoplanes sp. ATCC 53533]RSM65474.1 hypothetical protein DMB66_16665 [Actinoplanes sp. ATCC 53533]